MVEIGVGVDSGCDYGCDFMSESVIRPGCDFEKPLKENS